MSKILSVTGALLKGLFCGCVFTACAIFLFNPLGSTIGLIAYLVIPICMLAFPIYFVNAAWTDDTERLHELRRAEENQFAGYWRWTILVGTACGIAVGLYDVNNAEIYSGFTPELICSGIIDRQRVCHESNGQMMLFWISYVSLLAVFGYPIFRAIAALTTRLMSLVKHD
ncbi:MAG: hypothetical protein AAF525_21475 [Pseudomonadota bacterium]